ncbi:hypothetical protein K439DRAFT_418928 [Ramaria rubella]|nr:hypothetical protein K439DRAFT_418928 [Ramaria rubella]
MCSPGISGYLLFPCFLYFAYKSYYKTKVVAQAYFLLSEISCITYLCLSSHGPDHLRQSEPIDGIGIGIYSHHTRVGQAHYYRKPA